MPKVVLILCMMLSLTPRSFRFAQAVRSVSMRSIAVDSPGPNARMRVSTDSPQPSASSPNDVVLRVAYSGVNRADVLQRLGRYPVPPGESETLGLEASGLVEAVGSGVVGLKVGDRVAALLGGGGYAEFARVNAGHCLPLPGQLSLRSAAAIPEAWLTAYQLLFLVGDFAEGDSVLVHAAASGVGTAAVQLVKAFGGVAFGTAGSADKCQLVRSLGASGCFNYKEVDFAQAVLDATGGRGVDVVLDCVGGSHASANLRCLATDARWVLYGLLGGGSVKDEKFLRTLLNKRASVRASLLRNRSDEYKRRLVSEFSSRALPLFSAGRLRPIVHSVLPLAKVEEAHRLMEGNANAGKILLAIDESLDGGRGQRSEL